MVKIVRMLRSEASGKYANLKIMYIRQKFMNYIDINEYDGLETIKIDLKAYLLTQIAKCLESSHSPEEKIREIDQLLKQTTIPASARSLTYWRFF